MGFNSGFKWLTSSLLGPSIPLSTQFSNTLSLCSSLNVSDQVSHPYKTARKIIVLYILIFIFLDSKLKDKSFCTNWYQVLPESNLFLILCWIEFWLINPLKAELNPICHLLALLEAHHILQVSRIRVKVVPKYFNCSILSKEILSLLYCDLILYYNLEAWPRTSF